MFGRKKREDSSASVVNASIGSGDVPEPAKVVKEQPELSKREREILALVEELHADYGLLSPTEVANMSQVAKDAYMLNLALAIAVEVKLLRMAVERMDDGDRI